MCSDKEMKFENLLLSTLSGKEQNYQPSQICVSLRVHSPFASRQRDRIPAAAANCPVVKNEEERTSTTTASATDAEQ
jgi:hypothetical protein